MTTILQSVKIMLKQLRNDAILGIAMLAPIIAGFVFRFGIPFFEEKLVSIFSVEKIITPYYQLIDVFLVLLTPMMFSYVIGMVMLEEQDDRVISYLSVTPLRRKGYLVSRLGVVALISVPYTILISTIFSIVGFDFIKLLLISITASLFGLIVTLTIVTFSSNKIEGMAMAKITMLLVIGIFVPYFVAGSARWLFWILPTFWIAQFSMTNNYVSFFIAISIEVLWLFLMLWRYESK